ncbi:MAG: winged helix-turn-helix domain-containing protein [Chloroflexi bacterium]|nr:winged helix-turn-helix domain-containing protein [Chloroflexota bacterium]
MPSIVDDGAALVLDDFHLGDEVADIRQIVREIVARAPERLSIVFASRRPPAIPVAKLRSLGELAELGIADLRFSDTEMEQLFRETYGRPLEPDVLTELARRTEGWAASLTLIQAALRERSPAETRSFVRSLSGARDELHDYLAEEVVGDLPEVQQQFLMRTSILQRVTTELAQVASGFSAMEVQSMVAEAERLGLLGRRARRRSAEQRYHPLVREFLEDRLRREVGPDGVTALHVTVARWAEPTDWQTAAHHYASCYLWADLRRVIEANIATIVASGAFVTAADLVALVPGFPNTVSFEIVKTRVASLVGDLDIMLRHASRAVELEPASDIALSNLVHTMYLAGDGGATSELAGRLAATAKSGVLRELGAATQLTLAASMDGSLVELTNLLTALAERNRESGHHHYEGVSLLNASLALLARGDGDAALRVSSDAIDALTRSSSGSELVSANLAKARALAWQGQIDVARGVFEELGPNQRHAMRVELDFEIADMEVELGAEERASRAIRDLNSRPSLRAFAELVKIPAALLCLRERDYDAADRILAEAIEREPTLEPGRQSRFLAVRAYLATMTSEPMAPSLSRHAVTFADRQGADRHRQLAALALAACEDSLSLEISSMPTRLTPVLSVGAELIVDRLDGLSPDADSIVTREATLRPERWRQALRRILPSGLAHVSRLHAARLLDVIGDRSDIPVLRRIAREPRRAANDRTLGRGLARRLAPRIVVHDLGRVRIAIGEVELSGGTIRRKVLALLCFLLTRPQLAATREEVMEALWPDIDPTAASNSLNQTIYFLRRVFEAEYDEEHSPGYLRQESDLVFLDEELVQAASATCVSIVRRLDRQPSVEDVDELSQAYVGRFASDFAYEDWAVDFRDWLHVAYLQIMEREITAGIETGEFNRSVTLARRALSVDPRLDTLGLSLLKLLKGVGAHSAAAEQYEHYASLLRSEIGVDPPPFESI